MPTGGARDHCHAGVYTSTGRGWAEGHDFSTEKSLGDFRDNGLCGYEGSIEDSQEDSRRDRLVLEIEGGMAR